MEARVVDLASPARRYAHSQSLVRQGQVPDCLFLVRAGVIRLAATLPSGHVVVVSMLGPGDVFGESALLGDPSPVEARAASPVQVEAVPLTALQAVLERSPETAAELLRMLASRLHRTTGALEEALAQDVPTRLCRTLCELAERHGVREGRSVRLALPITQEDLGRMIGASRETVNRTLATLSARNLIRSEGRRCVIRDIDALARASDREATTA